MEISEKRIEDMDVLVLTGRLEASSAKELKGRVDALVKEKRVKLIVDMAGVDFIDSSGLGSLVSSLRAVNEQKGDIKVVSLQKQVRSIFELTRLHRIFGIFDDVEAAIKSF
ncbi:MAG: STAS domain-containing protein [Deltaproteobacteria bacterium]|nr:STAS domain-containing protein [Deltaproteobacteria bacterium]